MKLKTILIAAAMSAVFSTTCLAQGITVSLNGTNISFANQQPVVVEGRTLIPLRGVFDKMGYAISWNAETKSVTLTKGSKTIIVNVGDSNCYVNNKPVKIDVPAQIINGSTMLPLRAIADAADCSVLWDNETKTATIVDSSIVNNGTYQANIVVTSQQEANYIDSYTKIINDYNKTSTEFLNFVSNFNNASQLPQLGKLADSLYQASTTAKTQLSSLNCPSKYTALHNTSIKYVQSISDLAKLYSNLVNGNVAFDEAENKINTLFTQALAAEAEYRRIFEQTVNK